MGRRRPFTFDTNIAIPDYASLVCISDVDIRMLVIFEKYNDADKVSKTKMGNFMVGR
jgi:hypothetical protein